MRRVLLRLTKKSNLPIVVIALAFALVGFMIARQVAIDNQPTVMEDQDCPVSACVALKTGGAEPDTLTVVVGESVQFNSADGNTHSLSQGLGGEEHLHTGPYSSGDFGADEAWRVQFNKPGTFKFHDHYNPEISILVVAYEPGNVKPIEL